MPTYEYACKTCGEHLEVVQSFKDNALTECAAVRWAAAKGLRQHRHHVQGQRLLQDRQPVGRPQGCSKSAETKAGEGKASEAKSGGEASSGSSGNKGEASSSSGSSGSSSASSGSSGSKSEGSSKSGSAAVKAAS